MHRQIDWFVFRSRVRQPHGAEARHPARRSRSQNSLLALQIREVVEVRLEDLTREDAEAAGMPSLDSLVDELTGRDQGRFYRVVF